MKNNTFLLIVALFLSIGAEAQLTLNDITLPATITKDNTPLLLNGGGIRKKLFFKLYTGGLYLNSKSKNAADIINADLPTAFRLTVTSGVLNSNNFSEAIQEGFEKSLGGNTKALQAKIDEFINTFKKEEVKEGDVYELWYFPGKGVSSYKNGVLKSTVAGLDFKKALFGIWLSTNPVDEDLKKGLLGN